MFGIGERGSPWEWAAPNNNFIAILRVCAESILRRLLCNSRSLRSAQRSKYPDRRTGISSLGGRAIGTRRTAVMNVASGGRTGDRRASDISRRLGANRGATLVQPQGEPAASVAGLASIEGPRWSNHTCEPTSPVA